MNIKTKNINKKNTLVNKQIKYKHKHKKYKICKIYIKSTFNNTFVTLTNIKGGTLKYFSAGKLKFKGSKRSTSYAAESVILQIAKYCLNSKIKIIQLYLNGIGSSRNLSIKLFKSLKIKIKSINEITPIPFNGCRLPKKRRI